MTIQKRIEKGISDLVGALTDPIIVFPGGWGDTLPEWLKEAIIFERLEMCMRAHKEKMTGTDAEACAYLYAAALSQPLDDDWAKIYLFVATKTYRRWGKGDIPNEMAVESLDTEEMADLERLKQWLYRKRTQTRLEQDRAKRRQKRQQEVARRGAEQPALFEF